MAKRIRESFKNRKLSGKMMAMYLVVTGITCLIVMTVFQVSLKIYDRQLYGKAQQELEFFAQRVNGELDEIEALSLSIAIDAGVQEKLLQMSRIPYLSSTYYFELQEFRSLLTDKLSACPSVKSIIYTDGKKVTFTVGTDCGTILEAKWKTMLQEFKEARGGYVFWPPTREYPYLLSGRSILERKNASLNDLGALIFTSDIAGLLEEKSNELAADHVQLYVYSSEGVVYQENEPVYQKLPSVEGERGYCITTYQGKKMFLCFERSKPTGWMYVNLFPYSEVFGSITMVRWLIFGGFLAALAIALLVMKRISGSITQPLEKLSELMKMVESGDFQAVKQEIPNIIGEDEVGVLTREFRIMLDKMDYLIYENYEKQLLLQDTRYKMLQSQINPHFLYNTLNTINWMARAGKCKEVSTMILELGKLLRASFAKDSYTSVAEELNTAKSYMAIQKYRYQSRVEFVVEAEGDLERYMVPRMILQPLIENSIQYGVEESMRACVIRVTAREEAKSVMLEVKDQGKGMTREELEAVRNATVIPKGHGIGLKNIQERLKITYTAYEMRIESQPGEGTSVFIRVPKEEKGLEHVQTSDRR